MREYHRGRGRGPRNFLMGKVLLVLYLVCMSIMIGFTTLSVPLLYNKHCVSHVSTQSMPQFRPTTFLLGVFCRQEQRKERDLLRSTMFGEQLPGIILVQLCSLNQFLTSIEVKTSCNIIYTFVIGGNSSGDGYFNSDQSLIIDHGTLQEGDVTVLNIKENMNEGKTPSWFHYVSSLNVDDIDYVAKSDLDTLISIPALTEFVNNTLPSRQQIENPSIYGGILCDITKCGGPTLLQCKKLEGKFYMTGEFYFISHDIVMMKHLWLPSYHFAPNEDVDFAIRLWQGNFIFHALILNSAPFWMHELKKINKYRRFFKKLRNSSWMIKVSK